MVHPGACPWPQQLYVGLCGIIPSSLQSPHRSVGLLAGGLKLRAPQDISPQPMSEKVRSYISGLVTIKLSKRIEKLSVATTWPPTF